MTEELFNALGTGAAGGYLAFAIVANVRRSVQRFLEDIGVDPVDRETLMAVDIHPYGVTIERARVRKASDGARRNYSTAKDGWFTATQTTTCRIVWSA